MNLDAPRNAADYRIINLLVPGGGLIMIGDGLFGAVAALAFTASVCVLIAAAFLIPDEISRLWRGLALGVTVGAYLGAQIRYAQSVRIQSYNAASDRRNAALRLVRTELADNRPDEAWRLLEPLAPDAEVDLTIAFVAAQVLTQRGDGQIALNAWRRVRRLDRHRIYSDETSENMHALTKLLDAKSSAEFPESRTVQQVD